MIRFGMISVLYVVVWQPGWDVTDGSLDIVGDPLNEVAAVLVLDIEHLLIHLLHGHPTTEHSSHGKVATMSRVAGSHHVFSIKHLLGKLWYGEGSRIVGLKGVYFEDESLTYTVVSHGQSEEQTLA